MKKIVFSFALAITSLNIKSQVIVDTVSIGAGYANQVWYSLENDNQGSAPKNNWDLAFDVSGQGSNILINSVTGVTLWNYPSADTTGWSTFDTTGVNNWTKRWNSDTSWTMGAMGRYASLSSPNDLDWGIYSPITHIVTGDSLYLIKLANGAYKKLQIKSLNGGIYYFRYADLNGANLQNATLTKATYTNQNFGYYSIQNNTALAREPVSSVWDLLFTQYTAFVPTPYTVTGIVHNKGVRVAKVKPIANPNTYLNWTAHTFKSTINEIGYDWKVFGTGFVIEDSLLYFVKSKSGSIWKIIPTGFSGSTTGSYIFSKEKISSVGINEMNGENIATMALYPNPSNGSDVTIILSANDITQIPVLTIYDLNGRILKNMRFENLFRNQMNTMQIDASEFENGIYTINLKVGNASANQKLIINK